MTGYVFSSNADALAFQAAVDTALGYPKPATPTGGGTHDPNAMTLHYGYIIAHPNGTQWAHPSDATVDAVAPEGSPTPVELTSDWFPPDEL